MSFFKTLSRSFSRIAWRRLLGVFLLFIIPLVIFVRIASEVREQDTLQFDEATLRAINNISSPTLDTVNVVLTQLGGLIGVLCLMILACVFLWQYGKTKWPAFLLVSVGGAVVLNLLIKAIFARERPELWERLVTENSYSFPSGHAMASSALAFSLIVIAWETRWRYPVLIAGLLYVAVIGFTRLYLGVHYPTDIVAGWAVSAAWVAIVSTFIIHGQSTQNHLSKKSY